MNRKAELKYIAGELELIAESIAELTDAIDVYQHREDKICSDIYERVENLRAEAFQLHDQVATLVEEES